EPLYHSNLCFRFPNLVAGASVVNAFFLVHRLPRPHSQDFTPPRRGWDREKPVPGWYSRAKLRSPVSSSNLSTNPESMATPILLRSLMDDSKTKSKSNCGVAPPGWDNELTKCSAFAGKIIG